MEKNLFMSAYDNETDEISGFMSPQGCTHWMKSMIKNFPVDEIKSQDDRFYISYNFMTDKQFKELPEAD